MRYSDAILNKIMPILEEKMEMFKNPDWDRRSALREVFPTEKYGLDGFKKYIKSIGGRLLDDPYPEPAAITMSDEDWEELCDKKMMEIEADTGMFPVYLPSHCGRYRACLLPHDLVEKAIILGDLP